VHSPREEETVVDEPDTVAEPSAGEDELLLGVHFLNSDRIVIAARDHSFVEVAAPVGDFHQVDVVDLVLVPVLRVFQGLVAQVLDDD